MSFLDFFVTRKLSYVLDKTYKVKVHGVKFELRKINPIDYVTGSRAVLQIYETYKVGNTQEVVEPTVGTLNKMKEHYIDVFMAAVVSPKLRRDENSKDGILVSHLFSDWDLANDLYAKILNISYGKKKMKYLASLKK